MTLRVLGAQYVKKSKMLRSSSHKQNSWNKTDSLQIYQKRVDGTHRVAPGPCFCWKSDLAHRPVSNTCNEVGQLRTPSTNSLYQERVDGTHRVTDPGTMFLMEIWPCPQAGIQYLQWSSTSSERPYKSVLADIRFMFCHNTLLVPDRSITRGWYYDKSLPVWIFRIMTFLKRI